MTYNISKLLNELKDVGITIYGVNSKGEIHFTEDTTEEQKIMAKVVVENHNPYDYKEWRKKEYEPEGDQFDRIYKALKQFKDSNGTDWNGIDEWFNNIGIVKSKWTKEYADLAPEQKQVINEFYNI